jgi:hypothetical protein
MSCFTDLSFSLMFRKNKLLSCMYNFFINDGHPERVYLFYEYLTILDKSESFKEDIKNSDSLNSSCFLRLSNIPTEICKRNPIVSDVDTYLMNVNISGLRDDFLINILLIFFEGINNN